MHSGLDAAPLLMLDCSLTRFSLSLSSFIHCLARTLPPAIYSDVREPAPPRRAPQGVHVQRGLHGARPRPPHRPHRQRAAQRARGAAGAGARDAGGGGAAGGAAVHELLDLPGGLYEGGACAAAAVRAPVPWAVHRDMAVVELRVPQLQEGGRAAVRGVRGGIWDTIGGVRNASLCALPLYTLINKTLYISRMHGQ